MILYMRPQRHKTEGIAAGILQKTRFNDTIHEPSKALKIRNCCGPPSKSKV